MSFKNGDYAFLNEDLSFFAKDGEEIILKKDTRMQILCESFLKDYGIGDYECAPVGESSQSYHLMEENLRSVE